MLIEKEDAIKAVCEACYMYKYIGEHYKDCKYYPCDDVTALEAVSEAPKSDVLRTDIGQGGCDNIKTTKSDLISRADAIDAVDRIKSTDNWQGAVIALLSALPSAEAVKVKAEQLPPKVPTEWINDGMVLVPQHDWIEMQKELEGYASAEAVQIPIKLEKRYPESKDEDITDAFMRGYLAGRSSAEAVQGWIPCSERLPITDGYYLTTMHGELCGIDHAFTSTCGYECGEWDEGDMVIAWMPLPTPYKGGEDE